MEIGSTVGGRYRIESVRGGELWIAEDTGTGEPVAVKILTGPPGPAVRLRHPGIVTVLEVGEHEGSPFIAMELLDGYTLDDHLLDGWYGAGPVADFGAQIAEALAAAHRAGTTHGAIEPARLLLTRTGTVKILGFGTVTPAAGSSDLSALGDTLHQLLGCPALPGSLGELGVLVSELRDVDHEQDPDPDLTEEFAARLRRLADEPAQAEPAGRPRPSPPRQQLLVQRLLQLLVQRLLGAVIVAGLIAVTAYAIAVTV